MNEMREKDSSAVVSTVASQRKGPGFESKSVVSVWNLRLLPVPVWVLSEYSSFFPV